MECFVSPEAGKARHSSTCEPSEQLSPPRQRSPSASTRLLNSPRTLPAFKRRDTRDLQHQLRRRSGSCRATSMPEG
ncbi:hypothetical protein GQ53DRAFT_745467 [Thozetella sp. PMI_491]|nr:hypothetical protein GQ53DRAFT_745467 [Thozetella sp. PMI_491]